ncbi:unnamed protein product, partial [Amoebophrya sp. A25]
SWGNFDSVKWWAKHKQLPTVPPWGKTSLMCRTKLLLLLLTLVNILTSASDYSDTSTEDDIDVQIGSRRPSNSLSPSSSRPPSRAGTSPRTAPRTAPRRGRQEDAGAFLEMEEDHVDHDHKYQRQQN